MSSQVSPYNSLSVNYCVNNSGVPGLTPVLRKVDIKAEKFNLMLSCVNDFILSICKNETTKSYCVSPASILQVLGMLFLASSPQDRFAYRKAMNINETITDDELMTFFSESLKECNPKNGSGIISSINAILLANSVNPRSEFLETYCQTFGKGDGIFHFSDNVTPQVNQWVSDNTRGFVRNILQNAILTGVEALFLNALYVQLDWVTPFDKSITSDFICNDGSKVSTEFMNKTKESFYCELDGYQLIKIPFENSKASFIAILPPEGEKNFEKEFTLAKLEYFYRNATKQPVKVSLPKLHIESSVLNVMTLLNQAGIPIKHTLENMLGDQSPSIVDACSKIVLDVSEEGAIGGAGTVAMTSRGDYYASYAEFNANRPFMFLLVPEDLFPPVFFGSVKDESFFISATMTHKDELYSLTNHGDVYNDFQKIGSAIDERYKRAYTGYSLRIREIPMRQGVSFNIIQSADDELINITFDRNSPLLDGKKIYIKGSESPLTIVEKPRSIFLFKDRGSDIYRMLLKDSFDDSKDVLCLCIQKQNNKWFFEDEQPLTFGNKMQVNKGFSTAVQPPVSNYDFSVYPLPYFAKEHNPSMYLEFCKTKLRPEYNDILEVLPYVRQKYGLVNENTRVCMRYLTTELNVKFAITQLEAHPLIYLTFDQMYPLIDGKKIFFYNNGKLEYPLSLTTVNCLMFLIPDQVNGIYRMILKDFGQQKKIVSLRLTSRDGAWTFEDEPNLR